MVKKLFCEQIMRNKVKSLSLYQNIQFSFQTSFLTNMFSFVFVITSGFLFVLQIISKRNESLLNKLLLLKKKIKFRRFSFINNSIFFFFTITSPENKKQFIFLGQLHNNTIILQQS